jgi:hypothetical protein
MKAQLLLLVVMAVALFLILQSCKSGFDSPSPVVEKRLSESGAQSTEIVIESTRAMDEAGFKSSSTSTGKGNAEVLMDLEGSVNQRNYPMVGKDQGGLDIPSGDPSVEIDGANAVPVNVNSLAYPIEGYDMSPFMETPEDWFKRNTEQMLDVNVPSTVIPDTSKISPTQGSILGEGNMLQSTSVINETVSGRSGK